MIRRLLWLAFFVLVAWITRNLLRRSRVRTDPNPKVASHEGGTMVRDRICNTFLPRSKAHVLRQDGEEIFFCSERCRSVWLEGRREVS